MLEKLWFINVVPCWLGGDWRCPRLTRWLEFESTLTTCANSSTCTAHKNVSSYCSQETITNLRIDEKEMLVLKTYADDVTHWCPMAFLLSLLMVMNNLRNMASLSKSTETGGGGNRGGPEILSQWGFNSYLFVFRPMLSNYLSEIRYGDYIKESITNAIIFLKQIINMTNHSN